MMKKEFTSTRLLVVCKGRQVVSQLENFPSSHFELTKKSCRPFLYSNWMHLKNFESMFFCFKNCEVSIWVEQALLLVYVFAQCIFWSIADMNFKRFVHFHPNKKSKIWILNIFLGGIDNRLMPLIIDQGHWSTD